MQNAAFYYEVGDKQMVRFSVTEGDVDGTEKDHPEYITIINDSEDGNDGYLKPDVDSSENLEDAVSLEMTHIGNNLEHDVDEMLDLEDPAETDEEMESYTDEYFGPVTRDPEQKIEYLIPKETGNEADEMDILRHLLPLKITMKHLRHLSKVTEPKMSI